MTQRLDPLAPAAAGGTIQRCFDQLTEPEEVRFGDLAVRGNQLAHELRRAGLRAGDRVAVMLRNGPEFVYAYAAHSQLGIETVPIDPRSRGEKLRYFLDFAGCRALITGD